MLVLSLFSTNVETTLFALTWTSFIMEKCPLKSKLQCCKEFVWDLKFYISFVSLLSVSHCIIAITNVIPLREILAMVC